tara:strand:- start:102 stop:308 length:207 start_codon:yes stop_codon:yes gene_type:complete
MKVLGVKMTVTNMVILFLAALGLLKVIKMFMPNLEFMHHEKKEHMQHIKKEHMNHKKKEHMNHKKKCS